MPPANPIHPALPLLDAYVRRGETLRCTPDLQAFDSWKDEVAGWLAGSVSSQEALKFRLLIDAPLGRGIGSVLDGMIFARVSVLKAIREQLVAAATPTPEPSSDCPIRLFVSHAKEDEILATAFVAFVRDCIDIPRAAIRCTSVAGHKLETGANAPSALLAELRGAPCAVGLITTSSAQSAWVQFELGARWALNRHVATVLGPDLGFDLLPGPLRDAHATTVDDVPGLLQLIEELAAKTGCPAHAATFPEAVERLGGAVGRVRKAAASKARASPRPAERPTRKDILTLLLAESLRPSDAADSLARLGMDGLVETLRAQETYLRDEEEPGPLDRIGFQDRWPYRRMERVVAALCEALGPESKAAILEAARRTIDWRLSKGGVVHWQYRTVASVLHHEIELAFGTSADAVVREIFDGLDPDQVPDCDLKAVLDAARGQKPRYVPRASRKK